ncbi:MAG TPA: ribulose-phosphate 3-epimerase [Calditrichaeota bacterium]|nr:ribulose-phosphate 3-epimerase [Calditrichota bacterium]
MNRNRIRIAPSILSCDLLQLEEQVRLVSENGADFIHVDIMDGHFVPNLTFGPGMVKTLRRITDLPLDVHLMIERPDEYLAAYIEAGAHILTVHQEACVHLHRTVQRIHQLGARAGVSLNPATSLTTVEEVLADLDLLLVMTVNPGFGGQAFIPGGIDKVKRARKMVEALGKEDFLLEVDGGINEETAGPISEAGANVLVAGNAIFNQPDIVRAMHNIRAATQRVQLDQA